MGRTARFVAALEAVFGSDPERACARVAGLEPTLLLARSRTTETAVVEAPGVGRMVRKRWTFPEPRDRWRGVLRTTLAARSPAAREFEALTRLRTATAPPFAPEPLGFVEERRRGFLRRCHLLLREVPGAVDLAHWLRQEEDERSRRAVLAELAHRTAAMHAHGLVDGDMHPRNVLVDGASRVWKVDCPKQRVSPGPAAPARTAFDLACLDVGLARLATARERARFLVEYLRGSAARTPRANRRSLARRIARVRARIDARESRRL